MTKQIVGSYFLKEEVIKAVDIYELTGHEAKNIIILTNRKNKETLEKLTDVAVQDHQPTEREKSSFTDKLKNLITHQVDFELNTHEKLIDYGLSAEDAERCLADLEAGKIVIVADDELRMGQ